MQIHKEETIESLEKDKDVLAKAIKEAEGQIEEIRWKIGEYCEALLEKNKRITELDNQTKNE